MKQNEKAVWMIGIVVALILVPEVSFAVQNTPVAIGGVGDTLVDNGTKIVKWIIGSVGVIWAAFRIVLLGRLISKEGRGADDLPEKIGKTVAGIVVVFGAYAIVSWIQQLFGAQIGTFA